MTLFEIAEKVGVHVGDLSSKNIIQARERGAISRGEAEKFLAELKRADGIWQNQISDIPCASSLW